MESAVDAGVPTSVMVAPVIPGLTDSEMERILERAAAAGVSQAGYILLRLPLEIGDLFTEWLQANCPDRAKRVLSLMRSARGGKLYDAKWGERMVGDGPYAWMIGRRFELASQRLGLNGRSLALRTDLFTPPQQIAIKVGDEWKFYNPGTKFLPMGQLVWQEEANWAQVVSEDKYEWAKTPFTDQTSTATKRISSRTLRRPVDRTTEESWEVRNFMRSRGGGGDVDTSS